MSTSLPPEQPNKKDSPQPALPHSNMDDVATVLEQKREKITSPPFYQVVLLNDDYTPMEFVVFVIQEFFNKDHEAAIQIMLKIHLEGKGICGVFPRDIALTKVRLVKEEAQRASHPLQCVSEPLAS